MPVTKRIPIKNKIRGKRINFFMVIFLKPM